MAIAGTVIQYNAEPTLRKLHRSNKMVKGVMGPIGSGKSVGCCMEMFEVSRRQWPNEDGIRHSRWAIIRNTYAELRSTTIKTFQEWIPEKICPIVYDAPIRGLMEQKLPDGTSIRAEFMFIALDKPKDVNKLLSMELTGAFINEARELPFSIIKAAISRTGRYPSKSMCPKGIRWTGVIMDTNPPDDDHWWYNLAENVKPDGWDFFRQPGALTPIYDGKGLVKGYNANPKAENVNNHQLGYRYWTRNIAAADPEWIKVYCCGEYGSVFDGKPVYPMYRDTFHRSAKPLGMFRGRPIVIGWDFGLTPSCIIGQVTPKGQLRILRELMSDDSGLKQFVLNTVRPTLTQLFPNMQIISVGDPAGAQRAQADDEITCMGVLDALGIPTEPASTNDIQPRLRAVIDRLTMVSDGEPAILIDPSCKMLTKGFNGGYKFERVQVTGDERFKDKPCKNKFSHCIAGYELVDTTNGLVPIKDIKAGMYVKTPLGDKMVTRAWKVRDNAEVFRVYTSDGKTVDATSDHKIWANDSWIKVDALQYGDILECTNNSTGDSLWADHQSERLKCLEVSGITKNQKDTGRHVLELMAKQDICTEMSGSFTTESFLMDISCITGITINQTTTYPIWNYRQLLNMLQCIVKSGLTGTRRYLQRVLRRLRWRLHNGTKKIPDLIKSMSPLPEKDGLKRKKLQAHAFTAEKITNIIRESGRKDIALQVARIKQESNRELTMRIATALSAQKSSEQINTQNESVAVTVVKTRRLEERTDVYDLTVEDAHCFYANGVLVSNCHDALQYMCLCVDTARIHNAAPPPPIIQNTWSGSV